MPEIEVSAAPGAGQDVYDVTVRDGESKASYQVIYDEWGRKTAAAHDCAPERLLEACFRFLLDREGKESILRRFPLGVIGRYFPEVDERIGDYLG